MSSRTLRPLKKGDPCYVRIQRRGKPVLAVYDGPRNYGLGHWVLVDGSLYAANTRKSQWLGDRECIFVAKPVGEKTTGAEQ